MGIVNFIGVDTINWGAMAAGALTLLVPVFLATLLAQRGLLRGLTAGALKGSSLTSRDRACVHREVAAVDRELDAGDHGRGVGGEEEHGTHDLLRFAHPPEGIAETTRWTSGRLSGSRRFPSHQALRNWQGRIEFTRIPCGAHA